jgi:hypothetical protein
MYLSNRAGQVIEIRGCVFDADGNDGNAIEDGCCAGTTVPAVAEAAA